MNDGPLAPIEREAKGWVRVTTGGTSRDGLRFGYDRVELGRLHGSGFADLAFPKKVRNGLRSNVSNGPATLEAPNSDQHDGAERALAAYAERQKKGASI